MKALVLSGGGCKGAYQAGAILHLLNLGLEFDIICGSSVGAINASYLAQYPKDQFKHAVNDLIDFWEKLEQKQIYKRWFPFGKIHAAWKQSMYNSEPLQTLISDTIDKEKLKKSGVQLRIGTVSVKTGEYKIYNQKSDIIKKAIVASASFPPYFSPIKINDDLEYDAGLREYTPIRSAIKAGATEIYIICSETENLPSLKNPEDLKTLGMFKRFVSTLAAEVILNDFYETEEINQKVLSGECKDKKFIKCHIIKPETQLVEDSLLFDHDTIAKLINCGYNDAIKQIK